jgi:lysophospholipase L1-like esterase
MDSHNVQRHLKTGMVKNEGDVQMGVASPYPVSYRSIIPKHGECPNLLVPWSLSATHMAFGSIRMEPVFMGLSQSAAIAASMAIDQDIAVQDLPYAALRPVLLTAGVAIGEPAPEPPPTVVDNTNTGLVTITGAWTSGNSTPGFYGSDYIHDGFTGQGTKQVFFHIPSGLTGLQRVYLRWTEHTNRASNAPIEIIHRNGTVALTVNQRVDGAKWNLLGLHTFTGASTEGLVIKTTGANGYVIADAVGFSPVGPDDDSDNDGITDVRESVLGMNPEVSNASFISAVKSHPEYFDLHSENEIHDLLVTRPVLSGTGAPSFDLGFSMLNSDWSVFEDFSLTVPRDADRRYFRVALQSEPSDLVTSLAAGLNRKIVVYGTSLTAGGAWVGQMNTWLSAKYPGKITLINSGLSGKNSATGLSQLATKVLAQNPDIVFIEFAMNDAFLYSDGTPQLSVAQAQANLIAMIDAIQAQNPDVEIILQTMNSVWNSPSGSNESATLRPNLAAYYQMYRAVAAARGLMLIDHHPNWVALQQTAPASFQSYITDGVHPNDEGIAKITFPLLQWKLSGGLPLP